MVMLGTYVDEVDGHQQKTTTLHLPNNQMDWFKNIVTSGWELNYHFKFN